MPYLTLDNAKLFFDIVGDGEPIITTHGVAENGSYWSRTGVSERLAAAGYLVIDTDMRGHGRSVPLGEGNAGYDVETVAQDFDRIADHLGIGRFHLLTHATGGMAGLHYACHHSERLFSLMSTDSGSATIPTDEYADEKFENHTFELRPVPFNNPMADSRESMLVHETLKRARASSGGPFLNRLNANQEPDRCWAETADILATSTSFHVADFMRRFYTNPDPKIALLRQIGCPVLLLLGEHDVMFVKPNELMARVIPGAKHVVMAGLGHMTAIEDPEGLTRELLTFLSEVRSGPVTAQ
jgi:pimeloyl-ACP methyl ester carboxylesterase